MRHNLNTAMFDLKKTARSFRFALSGLERVYREEQNFRIQLAVAALVIVAMFALQVSSGEKAALTLAMVLVLVLELTNSIFERVVDLLKPRVHSHVREVKDVMAGAVLVASCGAVLVGLTIFWPYVWRLATSCGG